MSYDKSRSSVLPKYLRGVAVVLGVLLLAAAAGPTVPPPASRPAPAIDPERYRAHVRFLADDALEGRLPGTPGIERAAEYIAEQFAELGLEPAGVDGTFFQSFEVPRGREFDRPAAELRVDGLEAAWRVEHDWIPLPFTALRGGEGPLAFAGYGISAPEFGYDDYAGFDVTGKMLLVFRYEPPADDPAAPFGGAQVSHHAFFRVKAREAAARGAVALLIVHPPRRADVPDELYPFALDEQTQEYDLPIAHVRQPVAEAILRHAGRDNLATLQRKLDTQGPQSHDLGVYGVLQPGVHIRQVATRNVVARLPGAGENRDMIILGAHYDHLGNVVPMGANPGDPAAIHNGADDNASGTAGVLELARVLVAEPRLPHDVVFITFSAEEMGLLGSSYYAAHPTIDLSRVRAMINLDMIGRLRPDEFTIYGTTSGTELPDLVAAAAAEVGLEYRAPAALSGNSDHAAFFYRGIPYLFPFTGLHQDYHQPSDDWDLIDAPGACRVLALVQRVVQGLAEMENGPSFQPQDAAPEPEDLLMQPAAVQRQPTEPAQAAAGPAAPRLGIVPDLDAAAPGVTVRLVVTGLPAADAGIRPGDRIVRIADFAVGNIFDYQAILRGLAEARPVPVVVVRDGQERTLQVKLPRVPTGTPRN